MSINNTRNNTRTHTVLTLALVAAAGCNAAYGNDLPGAEPTTDQTAPVLSSQRDGSRGRTFSVDVVADCNRFVSEGVRHPAANPKFGDTFMQEGLMYKAGTLAEKCDGDGCGLHLDGSPEFPELVIGKFTCYGTFVGNGGATAQGTWIYSTQVFEFDAEKLEPNVFAPGDNALVSHGPERNDLAIPGSRAITGGYGKYRSASGEVVQTKVGFNPTTCENFTFDFTLEPRR